MTARTRVMLLSVLTVMVATLAGISHDDHRGRRELKVLTYNTHLLPRVGELFASHRGRGDYRAAAIGSRIAAYDLVGLCEVFDDGYRQRLIDAVESGGKPYHVVWTKKPPRKGLANGGLLLLSRFDIEEHHAITYEHASRFATHGFRADAFAAKGAIHARIRLGDDPTLRVDCFLTHLDSRSASARAGQLGQLADFIRTHAHRDRPALLMGDLNVPADSTAKTSDSPYTQLVAALASSGFDWADAWTTSGHRAGTGGTSDPLAERGGARIDYIWLSRWLPNVTVRDVQVLRYLDREVPEGSLSDHAGVECVLHMPGASGR